MSDKTAVRRYALEHSSYDDARMVEHSMGHYVTYADYVAMETERDGAAERARLLFDAKNEWADRARAAEAERDALRAAGKRVTDAFRAMGEAIGTVSLLTARQECESAMIALDAALGAMHGEGEG